jgi:adenylate kinase
MANPSSYPARQRDSFERSEVLSKRRQRPHPPVLRYFRLALVFCLVFSSGIAKEKAKWANPLVFIMLGPPGSGKATQSQILTKKYGIPTITAAQALKKDLDKKTKTSGMQGSVESGELLDHDATQELMKARLLLPDTAHGFILSGYPQTADQAKQLDQFLKDNMFPPAKVIFLETPDDVVTQRMLARRRADDKPDNIERRLKEYHAEVDFLVGWYKKENILYVDGSKTIPEVARQIDAQIIEAQSKRTLQVR